MATIGEMIVKLLADTSSFNASMDEAAAKVTASNDAMASSMATSMQSFKDFDNITKESVKSTEGLAQAQAALQAVQNTGAFTAEELAAKQALVDAAMLKVGKETQEASGALSMFTRNSRTMYSTSALITDAMTGQFSRMRREVAALGNETGAMAAVFRAAVSPIGLMAGAAAAVGVAVIAAADHEEKFEQAVLSTGNIIGMTGGQLENMAGDVGRVTGSSFDAVDAVTSLGRSGLFTGEQLRIASEAAVYFSQVTGEKMESAAKAIEQLQDKPKTAIEKLNDQYHFLNQSQAETVVELLNTGQEAQAAAVAVQAFHDAMSDRASEMLANTTALARDWKDLKGWIEGTTEALAEFINMEAGSSNVNDQLNAAYAKLANDQKVISEYGNNPLGAAFGGVSQSDIDKDVANINRLKQAMYDQEQQAKKTSQADQDAAQVLDKGLEHGKGHAGSIGDLETQFQEQEAAAHKSYDQMKVDAADFWNAQATNANNSAAVQAQAWQRYIQARHQLDEQGLRNESESDRKSEESARKAAEAAKRAAEGRARAEKEASEEIQQEIKKEHALMLQNAEGEQQIAQKRIAIDRQALQNQYDAHQISSAQYLHGQLKLDDELLAAELAYLRKKEELDAGDVAAVAKDQQQITLAVLAAQNRRLQDEDKTLKQSEERWKQYSQRIAGAFQNSLNSMLFQGQTLRNGLASVAESIAETFVEAVVDRPLQAFIAGEAQKLAAAVGFGAQKTATEDAQRATNTAADIADKTAAAGRAAGLAGAQGVASFAGAPWPIDMGAPAFGAAMVADALSYGSMASAAGGWERVPTDGMMAQLHKDEMVLPKNVADPVRNMVRSGSSGSTTHFHFQSFAPRDLAAYLKRNPAPLRAALAHAGRNGW